MDKHARETRIGILCAGAAYLAWGLLPVYFKQVQGVGPLVIVAHRVFWSVIFVAALLSAQSRWKEVLQVVRSKRTMLLLLASTTLIATNWLTFIYSVVTDQLLEASLGYFINPLVNVLLGVAILGERLRRLQLVALGLAAAGVSVTVLAAGRVPYLALILAITFSLYALLRKTTKAGPLVGLCVETGLLFPIAAAFCVWDWKHFGQPGHVDWFTAKWLIFAGVVTATPLIWFANGAKRLTLSTIGFMQYIGPTCQLMLAVLVYHEPFTSKNASAFALIWAGLFVYSFDAWHGRPRKALPVAAMPE